MGKLIVKFNDEVVDHVDLRQGDMKIGRRPGSDIVLDNLAVSGEHANIFTIGEDSFIQDLGSTNGTFINNKKIAKHHLRNGDAVVIGKHTLVYFSENQPAPSPDFAKTVIINPAAAREATAQSPTPVAATTKPPAAAPKGELRGAVVILSGANTGKRIELTKSVTNLGITGKRASSIARTDSGYLLMPSEDGDEAPKLNGRPLSAAGEALNSGDIIEVAGTRLQFILK